MSVSHPSYLYKNLKIESYVVVKTKVTTGTTEEPSFSPLPSSGKNLKIEFQSEISREWYYAIGP